MHCQCYFFSILKRIEHDEFQSSLPDKFGLPNVPLDMHGIYDEGSMENISPMIPINISCTPQKVENVYISANYYPD